MSSSGETSAAENTEKHSWRNDEENQHSGEKEESTIQLEQYHKDYLMERHGTIDLEPMPSHDPHDPLNWPDIKKNVHLILVAFHSMMAYFQAAAIIPAYEPMSIEYGVPISSISYLTACQILLLGLSPIFVVPFMNKYGRRPFLLASAFGAMAFNIGGGFCKTYGAQMATRIFAAIFISPACAIGSVVVTELCFSTERAKKTGVWALLGTLGSPSGPFFMGFVQQHAGTKWIYFTLAICNFFMFFGYLFFGPETLYDRESEATEKKISWLTMKKLNSNKITLMGFLNPFKICKVVPSTVALFSHSFCFVYANVALIVEMPQVFIPKFGLGPQQMGLQFIAIIIGSVLGEQLAGPISDWWMKRNIERRGTKVIEDRLWLAYPGFITIIVGLIVWGCLIQNAVTYTVTPLVGAGIAAFGNQLITTVLITYAVDVDYSKSSEVGLVVNFVRALWAFIGPFYLPTMFENLGVASSGGLMAALVGGIGGIPIVLLHFYRLRQRKQFD